MPVFSHVWHRVGNSSHLHFDCVNDSSQNYTRTRFRQPLHLLSYRPELRPNAQILANWWLVKSPNRLSRISRSPVLQIAANGIPESGSIWIFPFQQWDVSISLLLRNLTHSTREYALMYVYLLPTVKHIDGRAYTELKHRYWSHLKTLQQLVQPTLNYSLVFWISCKYVH
jgi:hypothetical protein